MLVSLYSSIGLFCSSISKNTMISFILTIVFVIIINEFLASEKEEEEEVKGSESFNKQELEKTINKLKTIYSTM